MALEDITAVLTQLKLNFLIGPMFIIFTMGLIYFAIYYMGSKEFFSIKRWNGLDSFGKIMLIFVLGMFLLVPPILFALDVTFIKLILYQIVSPSISGESLDLFKPLFLGSAYFYFLLHVLIILKINPKGLQDFLNIQRKYGTAVLKRLFYTLIVLTLLVAISIIIRKNISF